MTNWRRALAVVMVCALFVTAFAGCKKDEEDTLVTGVISGDYQYTRSEKTNTARISKYSGSEETLEIPQTLDNLPVVAIESNTFAENKTLKQVTLPSSVERVENGAFKKCTALTSVKLGDSLTYIGAYAFSGCTALTSVAIPNSVTTIGDNAFAECASLRTVVLGDKITTVGITAFYGTPWYASLTEEFVIIGDGVLIDYNGEKTNVTIPKEVKHLTSTFANDTMLFGITLPEGMTVIDNNAFQGCTNLSQITIPDSVTEIGAYAFARCNSLSSINLSENVTTVGTQAFTGCIGLRDMTIPSSVTVIPAEAFSGCSNLSRISFPDTLDEIQENAFINCGSLSVIAYAGSEKAWKKVTIAEGNETLSNAIMNYENE